VTRKNKKNQGHSIDWAKPKRESSGARGGKNALILNLSTRRRESGSVKKNYWQRRRAKEHVPPHERPGTKMQTVCRAKGKKTRGRPVSSSESPKETKKAREEQRQDAGGSRCHNSRQWGKQVGRRYELGGGRWRHGSAQNKTGEGFCQKSVLEV